MSEQDEAKLFDFMNELLQADLKATNTLRQAWEDVARKRTAAFKTQIISRILRVSSRIASLRSTGPEWEDLTAQAERDVNRLLDEVLDADYNETGRLERKDPRRSTIEDHESRITRWESRAADLLKRGMTKPTTREERAHTMNDGHDPDTDLGEEETVRDLVDEWLQERNALVSDSDSEDSDQDDQKVEHPELGGTEPEGEIYPLRVDLRGDITPHA